MDIKDILIDDELANWYLNSNSPDVAILIKPLGESSIEIVKEELYENSLIPKRDEILAIIPIEEIENWIKKIKVVKNDKRGKLEEIFEEMV